MATRFCEFGEPLRDYIGPVAREKRETQRMEREGRGSVQRETERERERERERKQDISSDCFYVCE